MKRLKGQDSTKIGKFEYYRAGDGWRWRLVAANGANIAHGGEGFSSKQAVVEAIHDVIDYSATVAEDRPERLRATNDPKRREILCGCGTVIVQEGEEEAREHDHTHHVDPSSN